MIYFVHSRYLFLMCIMPVLVAMWLLNRWQQSNALSLLGERKLIENIIIKTPLFSMVAKNILLFLTFPLLIIALAQPYVITNNSDTKQLTVADIVFVVDVSKSMYVQDIAPDRLSSARHLIQQIIEQLNGEHVAVVVFAGKANAYIPLTDDYFYINKLVDSISGNLVVQQGTSLREALQTSALMFDPHMKRKKVMCLLSDGEFHDNNAFSLADSIRRSAITLFTFGFGTTRGGEVPINYQPENEKSEKDIHGSPIISRLNSSALLRVTGNVPDHYIEVNDNLSSTSLFLSRLKVMEYAVVAAGHKLYSDLFLTASLILLSIELCVNGFFLKSHKKNAHTK